MTPSLGGGRPLDHVGLAVHSIARACSPLELVVGASCSPTERLEEQGVLVAFVGGVELLEPTGPDTPVGRFLARRGEGLHHVAFGTPDLEGDLATLAAAGLRLIDSAPRRGARGHRVAFLHPSSTGGVLVELVERHA